MPICNQRGVVHLPLLNLSSSTDLVRPPSRGLVGDTGGEAQPQELQSSCGDRVPTDENSRKLFN